MPADILVYTARGYLDDARTALTAALESLHGVGIESGEVPEGEKPLTMALVYLMESDNILEAIIVEEELEEEQREAEEAEYDDYNPI